ncbi:MAG: IS1 family transposase [Planctomycetota bacterium]
MIAQACEHTNRVKKGKTAAGTQRFLCKDCGQRFTESKPLDDARTNIDKAVMALNMLLEGMSIRATARLSGLDRKTIGRFVLSAGEACKQFMHDNIQNVELDDIQLDELWSFVRMKQKAAQKAAQKRECTDAFGDSYTFVAIDRETKLIPAFHVGKRTNEHTEMFLNKVADAVDCTREFQVTSDGFHGYQYNVPFALGGKIHFAQLVKKYKSQQEETRYSPATIMSAEKVVRFGNPEEDRICTSHVERANLTIRMHLRRFTRLTNGFSKKQEYHEAMQAIFFCNYNFVRKHSSIGMTPAMAAGLRAKPLTLKEILEQNV